MHLPQALRLGELFDALGHGREAELESKLDDRGDDGCVLRALAEAVHEGAVDLDDVDRHQVLEVRERGVAGAEIVDRELDAELLELGQRLVRAPGIQHDGALGELETEEAGSPCRRSAAATSATISPCVSWRSERLTDISSRRADALGAPGRGLAAGLVEHPAADGDDRPDCSAIGMKSSGAISAPSGGASA